MAYIYYYGREIPLDREKSIYWYQKAAEQRDPKAQYLLAFMYFDGQEVPQNYKLARYWFQKAAEQEYPSAQFFSYLSSYKNAEEEIKNIIGWKLIKQS